MPDQPGLEEARREIKKMLADLEIKVGSPEWFAAAEALNAAHSIIERAIREQVAKEIEASGLDCQCVDLGCELNAEFAKIARGGSDELD